MPRSRVTVVVCTLNRASTLRGALESLAQLKTEDLDCEILIVDNGSTDETESVIAEAARRSPLPVRSVKETERGVVHARNRGIRESHSDWIAFFDDDQTAHPDWLVELVRAAQRHDVRCAGGAVLLRLPEDRAFDPGSFCRRLLGETPAFGERPYDRWFKPGTGNLVIHRSVFDRVGLFDPQFNDRGEDTFLFFKMLHAGVTAWFTPSAIIYHVIPPERLTPNAFLQLTSLLASHMAEYDKKRWKRLFPLVWLIRSGIALGAIWPHLCYQRMFGGEGAILDAQCRWQLSRRRIGDGARFLRRPAGHGDVYLTTSQTSAADGHISS